jgi:hypothetical protein
LAVVVEDEEITPQDEMADQAVVAVDTAILLVDLELLVKVTMVVLDILYKKQEQVAVELAQLDLMLVRLLAVMVVQEQHLVLVGFQ